jgi:PKD repeat protein
VTGGAVYVGGHFRWANNPYTRDAAGQGAVSREGIAALDPANGLPLSWNPGRTKGVGVFDLLATPTGLWVGSDTDRIGNFEYHGRIAYFPLAGGTALPANATGALPGTLYLAGSNSRQDNALRSVAYDGTQATAPAVVAGTGIAWSSSTGSTMIDGNVYTSYSDGSFSRRAFDGSTFGPAVPVDGGDQIVVNTGWHTDAAKITGMFFDRGRLYYTLSGSTSLYYRGLATESGVVAALRYTASGNVTGVDFSRVSGMFLAGGKLYWASSKDGTLNRIDWSNGAPVAGTGKVVGGPKVDGVDWRSHGMFVKVPPPVAPNQVPTASLSASCTQLDCAFDGSGSVDPDGSLVSYAWNFGDGATATGVKPSHSYAATGEYQVSLTVTDNRGGTNTATQTVTVSPAPVTALGFVGTSAANVNSDSARVTVPTNVAAGDALVLIETTGTTVPVSDPTGLPGWQQVSSVPMGGTNGTTTVWSKVAATGDAGQPVTVTFPAITKAGLTLLAYTGTDAVTPVSAVQAAAETVSQTAHTTPSVTVPTAGSLVVSYWADRSSTTTAWTAPGTETSRSATFGIGGGHISTLVTDSGTTVPMGLRAGLTATADSASARASMVSIALRAKGSGLPNQAPAASLSVSCTQLDCAFDGSGSTDPDGTLASYAWDFGDGTTGTGVSPSHSYASAGEYQVSLTVTDDRGGQNTAGQSVTVAAAPVPPLGLVGVSASNVNWDSVRVTVPDSVAVGDTLVLFATTGTTVTVADPTGVTGWQQISTVPMGGTNGTTTVWSKVVAAGDAGKAVTVTLSAAAKAGVTLLAYTGTSTTAPVTAVQAAAETVTQAGHTTPAVTVPTAGSLVVSYWADRSSATAAWNAPIGEMQRSATFGTGGGHISTLVTDSGTGVAAGPRAGLTATADTASARATMVTVVLAPR